jgi:hypothetical protein
MERYHFLKERNGDLLRYRIPRKTHLTFSEVEARAGEFQAESWGLWIAVMILLRLESEFQIEFEFWTI